MPEGFLLARVKGTDRNNAVKCDFSTYFNLSHKLNLIFSFKMVKETDWRWRDAIGRPSETKEAKCNADDESSDGEEFLYHLWLWRHHGALIKTHTRERKETLQPTSLHFYSLTGSC